MLSLVYTGEGCQEHCNEGQWSLVPDRLKWAVFLSRCKGKAFNIHSTLYGSPHLVTEIYVHPGSSNVSIPVSGEWLFRNDRLTPIQTR